jgi:hypothetical protein
LVHGKGRPEGLTNLRLFALFGIARIWDQGGLQKHRQDILRTRLSSLPDRLLARSIRTDAAADRADDPVIEKRTEDLEPDSAILLAEINLVEPQAFASSMMFIYYLDQEIAASASVD